MNTNCTGCGCPLDSQSLRAGVCPRCGAQIERAVELRPSVQIPRASLQAFGKAARAGDAARQPAAAAASVGGARLLALRQRDGMAITGMTGSCARLVIPETLGGVPVTEIAEGAFRGRTDIVELVLSDSVQTVCESAFENCVSLASVQGGKGLRRICEAAFRNCPRLTAVRLTRRVDAFYSSFAGCYALGTLIEKQLDIR